MWKIWNVPPENDSEFTKISKIDKNLINFEYKGH